MRLAWTMLVCLSLSGCGGSSGIQVSGKLLKGGKPYKPPETERVLVTFYLTERANETDKSKSRTEPYFAQFNPVDSTFTVPGPEGQGIPPGKYRVGIEQKLKPSAVATAKAAPRHAVDRDADLLKERFSDARSPIERDLKTSTSVIIDLDSPNDETGKTALADNKKPQGSSSD